jgi:hypothetical protein
MATTAPTLDHLVLPPWSPDRGPVEARWTLRQLMAARCVSGGELAKLSGVSRNAVSRAVNGRGTASMPSRRRIAAALAVETDVIDWSHPQ